MSNPFSPSHSTLLSPQNLKSSSSHVISVGIEPLKARHDVTKLDLTIPLLSLWCIDIDLSIQLISLTLYMTCVH